MPPESPPLQLASLPRSRMLIRLGVTLFVGFLVASTISYLVSRNSIRQSILKNDLPLSSDNIYSEVQRDLFQPILISSLMANDTFVKDWIQQGEINETAILNYLKHIQERYHTLTSFFVSDRTRKYYHADRVLKIVKEDNPIDKWFFRVRALTTDYEINVDPDMANRDAMTIFINYRILDKDGNFLGATGVGLSVNAVKILMQKYRERYQRDVYFYDREGKLVLHSLDPEKEAALVVEHSHYESALRPFLTQLEKGKTDINFSEVTPNGTLAHFRYIPELNWILVIEQISDGTQPILFQSFGINLLICIITAAILFAIIRKTVLRYQQNLASRNRELQQKNYHIASQASKLTEANAKLEELHKEKDEFIGIIVHDLKNPLSAAFGVSEILAEHSTLTEEAREQVGYISLSTRSMLDHVDALLRLTELENVAPFPLGILNVNKVVREVVGEYEFQANTKHISITLKIPSSDLWVSANEQWLGSALGNLLSNAIKYSPASSEVIVSVQALDGENQISVSDNGEGIPINEQPRLFRKFERLSPRPTEGESSNGLGLYLVKRIVERMNGRVGVNSVPGKGSTFWIAFPQTSPTG